MITKSHLYLIPIGPRYPPQLPYCLWIFSNAFSKLHIFLSPPFSPFLQRKKWSQKKLTDSPHPTLVACVKQRSQNLDAEEGKKKQVIKLSLHVQAKLFFSTVGLLVSSKKESWVFGSWLGKIIFFLPFLLSFLFL